MGYKELKNVYKQVKSRERVRSTIFEDEVDKATRRENRRQSEKKDIEEALEEELEIYSNLDDYDDADDDFNS